jgi:hypothetical protein
MQLPVGERPQPHLGASLMIFFSFSLGVLQTSLKKCRLVRNKN